jgi:hypothetical protein
MREFHRCGGEMQGGCGMREKRRVGRSGTMRDAGLESGKRVIAMRNARTAYAVSASGIALSRISHPDPASRIGSTLPSHLFTSTALKLGHKL